MTRVASSLHTAVAGTRALWSTRTVSTLRAAPLGRAAIHWLRGQRGALALLGWHADAHGDRIAIVAAGTRRTYRELFDRVLRLIDVLDRNGVRQGRCVAMMLQNGPTFVELSAALNALGAVAVPISHRARPAELSRILGDAEACLLVFDAGLSETVREALSLQKAAPGAPRGLSVGAVEGFEEIEVLMAGARASDGLRAASARKESRGVGEMMVYTSGTTGHAKGARRSLGEIGYGPLAEFVARLPLRQDERHLVVCPMYHSAAWALSTIVAVLGGCNVIEEHFDPLRVLRAIEVERITSLLVVPTMLERLLGLGRSTLARHDLSSLRLILSGAAPLPTELARRVEDSFGPILYNFYGATETGIVTLAGPGEHTARPGTIGRVIPGNRIRLLDDKGREVPDGEVGELFAGSVAVMSGYHRDAAKTRDALGGDGLMSVGDLAWRDADGYYYLAGRRHDMVISGGVNIYPWEIEQRLHEHPAVGDAAVVGVADPEWGESLVAFVVVRPGAALTEEGVRAWVGQTLSSLKRPRRVVFVEELPRNPTGKLLKNQLRATIETNGAQAAPT